MQLDTQEVLNKFLLNCIKLMQGPERGGHSPKPTQHQNTKSLNPRVVFLLLPTMLPPEESLEDMKDFKNRGAGKRQPQQREKHGWMLRDRKSWCIGSTGPTHYSWTLAFLLP
jgi:hypothetical protein